ncbi:hypothetical protein L218DRAFT_727086 [Marasmius fiardii PR-910]|nr:hypothetical protein L218DRAFT_727086 [Marasmius fiardii PR-910]
MLRGSTTLHLTTIRHASSTANNSPIPPQSSTVKHRAKVEILRRRISKAETDKRRDITLALTPVKDSGLLYTRGFTRPPRYRFGSRFAGSAHKKKIYEEPSAYAYEPHTVFLLESRYHVRYGIRRVDHYEHVVGVCRTPDFEQVIKMYNSPAVPREAHQALDNARWPWQPQKKIHSVRWWNDAQELQGAQVDSSIPNSSPRVTISAHGNAQDAWTRPGDSVKASEKDVERQGVQTNSVQHRVSEENLDDIVVELKSRHHKVPFEVEMEDGSVSHPSGFLPPTAADKFRDPAAVGSNASLLPSTKPKRTTAIEDTHSEPVPVIGQWESIKARETEQAFLMPSLTAGILSGGVSADIETRNKKIPTEIDGVHDGREAQPTQHPSGFIPPTPGMARGEHEASTTAVLGSASLSEDAKSIRAQYFPFIQEEPFWRPLLAITVSTRPLANTLARLSRSLTRGLPFHASVVMEDRKSKTSLPLRLRGLRLERMQSLAVGLAQTLAGARGGLIGLRFSPADKGRGVNGEGFEKPIPWEKRVIGVGVGQWYPLSEEIIGAFEECGKTVPRPHLEEKLEPFLTYEMDEWGKPVDPKLEETFPWPKMALAVDSLQLQKARDVLRQAAVMTSLLDNDQDDNGMSQLRIVMPKLEAVEKDWSAAADLDVPITILSGGDPLPEDFDESKHFVLTGNRTRAIVKDRIDRLYGEYGDLILQWKVVRGRGVAYPAEAGESEESEDDENLEMDLDSCLDSRDTQK